MESQQAAFLLCFGKKLANPFRKVIIFEPVAIVVNNTCVPKYQYRIGISYFLPKRYQYQIVY